MLAPNANQLRTYISKTDGYDIVPALNEAYGMTGNVSCPVVKQISLRNYSKHVLILSIIIIIMVCPQWNVGMYISMNSDLSK